MNRAVLWAYFKDAASDPVDLSPRQQAVLLAVATNPGKSIKDISETLTFSRASVVRALESLIAQKLVRRVKSHDDLRLRAIFATTTGVDYLERLERRLSALRAA